jgi:methionyl-tRNA formyltransferase
MKIVLLCCNQSNQTALACKVAAEFNLAGIVVEKAVINSTIKLSLKKIILKFAYKTVFRSIAQSWWQMLSYYDSKYRAFPKTEILAVENINTETVKAFILKTKPDIVMVSGTRLLKKIILEIPLSIGMLNLHTGLSPYVKGAPNCTNWCIANGDFHFIGNSIMWIDAGIDSGDLLCTSIVKFTGKETLSDLQIKVMEEGHALYLKALHLINEQRAPRVKQSSIAKGKTYYSKDWDYDANKRLLKNFKAFEKAINSADYEQKISETVVVST